MAAASQAATDAEREAALTKGSGKGEQGKAPPANGKAKGKNLAKMRKKQQTISRESDQNKMLCRFGLRSFKNTTPNDLEALQKLPGITYEEGKLLGKLAVKAQNWSLAEVAYKLCLQYQLNEKGCREEAAIADTVQLSPIKRKSAMRRNNNNSSSLVLRLPAGWFLKGFKK